MPPQKEFDLSARRCSVRCVRTNKWSEFLHDINRAFRFCYMDKQQLFISMAENLAREVGLRVAGASQNVVNGICDALGFASHNLMIVIYSEYNCAAACVGERHCGFGESCGFVTKTYPKFQGLALAN